MITSVRPKTKRARVVKQGQPARVVTFTTRTGAHYFFHRYNQPEFDECIGKSEAWVRRWLAAHSYQIHWI